MKTLVIPKPSEKQRLFMMERHKYVAFGGARGGGKSWAVRVKCVLLCLKYPGIKCMIVRKTYPELSENHIIPLRAMLRCDMEDKRERFASYNDAKKHITFPNGSRILFRYLDKEKDAGRFQGTEVDVLFVDEATQQTEENVVKLNACVRGVNGFPKRVYYTCNPGGPGHGWLKRLFIDRKYNPGENPDNYAFIQSLPTDNKALMQADPEYIARLESLPPKLRKAWLEGDWDIFEGQYFEDFRTVPDVRAAMAAGYELSTDELKAQRRYTHVIAPFSPPKGWTIFRSFDWGFRRPFSCAWWAVDYEGVFYRIAELYGCVAGLANEGVKQPPDEVFRRIAEYEHSHPYLQGRKISGVADPAIWDAETGESVADVAARHRVYFTPGDHKRIAGWLQVHYRLAFDEQGFPMMYIFESCREFIRTIPTLVYDDHKVEDLDTEGEDHIADETRYACMSRPITPRLPTQPDKFNESPLHQFLDINKDEVLQAQTRPRMERIEKHGRIAQTTKP